LLIGNIHHFMSKQPNLDIVHAEHEGIQVLHLTGRLDTVTSPDAENRILEVIENGDLIVINLKELVFISSSGLRLILVIMKRAKKKQARVIFSAAGEHVLKLFEISNFLEFLELAETLEEALERAVADVRER